MNTEDFLERFAAVANNFEWISTFHLAPEKTEKLHKIITDRNFNTESIKA